MDALSWRIEWKDKGPFADEESFKEIQASIHKLGPSLDSFGTTFINLYDQYVLPPFMRKEFKDYFHANEGAKMSELVFGFNSKEHLEEGLRIDKFHEGRHLPREQFENLFSIKDGLSVKVYLVQPVVQDELEMAFDIRKAQLVDVAKNFSDFLTL